VPNRILAVVSEGKDSSAQAKIIPLIENKTTRDGKATAYVCEASACEFPTTDPKVFARQIWKVHPLPASEKPDLP